MLKKFAFTLAEVLITLGVIGVVSAITIPNLMTTHKAYQLRSQFLKSYSTIQQVFKHMQADEVPTDPDSYPRNQGIIFYKTFKNYLNSPLDCGAGLSFTTKTCYTPQTKLKYKTLNKSTNIANTYFDDGQLVLLDGTLLIFEQPNVPSNPYIWIFVDINGAETPPNILGYDLFAFEFLDNELRAMGSQGTSFTHEQYCSLSSSSQLNGIACAGKAKNDADYFKWIVKNVK